MHGKEAQLWTKFMGTKTIRKIFLTRIFALTELFSYLMLTTCRTEEEFSRIKCTSKHKHDEVPTKNIKPQFARFHWA